MRQPPDWYSRSYGKDPGAWEEAVDHCRTFLMGWARRGYVGYYTEIADEVTELAWPEGPFTHNGSQMGYLLGHVSVGEWLENRPLLSALVISKQEGHPGTGFYKLARALGELSQPTSEAELDYWQSEVTRCTTFWAS